MIHAYFVDIFIGFFGNVFNDVMIILFLALGVILGILLRPRFGNMVMKVIPRENRFIDFDIGNETAVSINCKEKKGHPLHRFYKFRPGFNGVVGWFMKKPVTRFIAKEGTAYTWRTEQTKEVKIGSLWEAVRLVCGSEFYNAFPPQERAMLEKSGINVTVNLEDGLKPEGFTAVSEEDIFTETDRKACETYWQGKKQVEKGKYLEMIIIGIAGFGVACALQIMGILRI